MSEYWKSTPKYWCKHCSIYVKDTPFERKQHENTGKHQGNLKRFLRGIQNDHERNEREKERAKAEVDRLNRVVGGHAVPAAESSSKASPQRKQTPASITAADQKRQWAQLADMGIQVPDAYRAEMAMPGQWQTVSKQTEEPTVTDKSLNVGVRKRKLDGQEEEDEDVATDNTKRRGWGMITRRYPDQTDSDLDALLNGSIAKKDAAKKQEPPTKQEVSDIQESALDALPDDADARAEHPDAETQDKATPKNIPSAAESEPIKSEDSGIDRPTALADIAPDAQPVFKKRKAKSKAGKETGS